MPWLEERFSLGYEAWIDRLVVLGQVFGFLVLSAETNGCGMMPAMVLDRQMYEVGRRRVVAPVTTSAKSKEDGFGFIRLLMQQGRLRLPRHTSLLKQLGALEYTMTEGGQLRIAVPEVGGGHDDLAMALCLAVGPLMAAELVPVESRIVGVAEALGDPELDHEFDYLTSGY